MAQDHWYRDAVFYELYIRAYADSNGDGHGDFRGVISKLDHIQSLGVDCIWILPMYPSPLKDDGYDVADYVNIHEDYGNLDDFRAFLDAAHERGLKVVTDIVMNHTSDQHPWFQAAREDKNSPYRDYYVWSDTGTEYADTRIIFLDTEPSNWTYDEVAGQYFWHRFYSSQPDLNYDNPQVHEEMFKAMRFWLDMGIDGFRVDAIPYLYEREGTNCENLPQTHGFLQKMRQMIDAEYPGTLLIAEANQWPVDLLPYFGTAENPEFHVCFHFPIMPRLYMALKSGDKTPIVDILRRTPAIPAGTQWMTFLRNHDELTLEMVTPEERQWMWEQYAPEPRMRLNLGIRRRLAPLLDNDPRKWFLLHAMFLSLPGAPIIYYGDEIGMGDNIWLPDRHGCRTPMQWDAGPHGGFSDAESTYFPVNDDDIFGFRQVNVARQENDPDSYLQQLRFLIRTRQAQPVLRRGEFEFVEVGQESGGNTAVLAFRRYLKEKEGILCLFNLSDQPQSFTLKRNRVNLLSKSQIPRNGSITIEPFGTYWFRAVWNPPEINLRSVKTGDMPGDKIEINQSHVEKANTVFPHLLPQLESLDGQRLIVSVYGGSGVGKSEIGSILGHYCNQESYTSYILSGDNYPHRIPKYNDSERLNIYRNAGLNALARSKQFSNDWMIKLHQKWPDKEDINPKRFTDKESAWMNVYFNAGKVALAGYLGTEKETNFSMVNHIIKLFKAGETKINLKRMGRTTDDIRYETVDFSGVQVLIIEWTHGNNQLLEGVDFPIFLFSTPAETLAHRLARGRDKNADSPLISLVLEIEQEKLISQAGTAKLIVSKNGELISLTELHKRLREQ